MRGAQSHSPAGRHSLRARLVAVAPHGAPWLVWLPYWKVLGGWDGGGGGGEALDSRSRGEDSAEIWSKPVAVVTWVAQETVWQREGSGWYHLLTT